MRFSEFFSKALSGVASLALAKERAAGLAARPRRLDCEVLEIKYGVWGFPMEASLAMKISLFILGVFAAIVCTEKSAEAEQNYPWCINKPDTPPQCRYTTLEQCLADRLGKGVRLAANSSGSFAMLAAIHRASSLLSNLAPYRNWSKRLLIRV